MKWALKNHLTSILLFGSAIMCLIYFQSVAWTITFLFAGQLTYIIENQRTLYKRLWPKDSHLIQCSNCQRYSPVSAQDIDLLQLEQPPPGFICSLCVGGLFQEYEKEE